MLLCILTYLHFFSPRNESQLVSWFSMSHIRPISFVGFNQDFWIDMQIFFRHNITYLFRHSTSCYWQDVYFYTCNVMTISKIKTSLILHSNLKLSALPIVNYCQINKDYWLSTIQIDCYPCSKWNYKINVKLRFGIRINNKS